MLIEPAAKAALAAGQAREAGLRDWLGEQRERDERGRLLLAMSVFVTTARQP